MSKVILDLQIACDKMHNLPTRADFQYWLQGVFAIFLDRIEITIRLVNELESRKLNMIYRGKNHPTNVLSFPFEMSSKVFPPLLGDLIICQQIVEREAHKQKKTLKVHWAHMVVHGSLHLLGYDHSCKKKALEMESLEIDIMKKFDYLNPYL